MNETKLNLSENKKSLSEVTNNLNVDELINDTPIRETTTYEKTLSNSVDPDLVIGYDVVKLPSKGTHYKNAISEVEVEYLTSKDEDILSTPALIENGTVFDVILKRKIKTPNVDVDSLLTGDKNAILLFLRLSSYGHDYTVEATDPRNGKTFESTLDLRNLDYKELTEEPDIEGLYDVFIPMRKKNVKFKLLTSSEERRISLNAESMMEAYNQDFNEFNTLKLKAQIIEIEGKRDKSYINKFVDAMPAQDSMTIRKKILKVTPDIDMHYEFKTKDGFKFKSILTLGVDFFFPNI